jgi:hypothetical protein
MLLFCSCTDLLGRILASSERVDVFVSVVFVVLDVFVVVIDVFVDFVDVCVGGLLDILTACVVCGVVTNVVKALDVVDSVLAFVKMGKSKNVLKGSNRAGKAGKSPIWLKSEYMSAERFWMALLFGNDVGVEFALGLPWKVLDIGDGSANLGFGRYFLLVKTTGFFSCGVFFP